MTPLDELLAHDWTIPLVALLLAVVVAAICWDIHRVNRNHRSQYRADHRISELESDLLGDNWLEPVRPYFTEAFIRRTRTRMAIYSATGADPYKKKSHAVGAAGSVTTKEIDRGRIDQ